VTLIFHFRNSEETLNKFTE